MPVADEAFRLHGISSEDLQHQQSFASVASRVGDVLRRADVVLMHMARWDAAALNHQLRQAGAPGIR